MDKETIASPPVQVFPTCWKGTPAPSVQVVTALRASTSPAEEPCQRYASHGEGRLGGHSLTVQSAADVASDLLSGLQLQAIYHMTCQYHNSPPQGVETRTIVPECGLSVISPSVSPVFPS